MNSTAATYEHCNAVYTKHSKNEKKQLPHRLQYTLYINSDTLDTNARTRQKNTAVKENSLEEVGVIRRIVSSNILDEPWPAHCRNANWKIKIK